MSVFVGNRLDARKRRGRGCVGSGMSVGVRNRLDARERKRSKVRRVGNALTRREGVGVFGSALLRREGVRGFRFGIGCSGVIQMTRDGRRQVGVGRIGVGTVTVVTISAGAIFRHSVKVWVT